jgi:hypothetical protein
MLKHRLGNLPSTIGVLAYLLAFQGNAMAQLPDQQQNLSSSAPSQITVQTNNNSQQATPPGAQVTIQQVFCPQPSELVKNGLYWGTRFGDWKSYSESFHSDITGFIGAQWVGINVGKMICIYKGNEKIAFPVTLQSDTLAQTPMGGHWGRSDLGGYRNCESNNVYDCPFIVKKQVTNMEQIYESIHFFKNKPDSTQGTPAH